MSNDLRTLSRFATTAIVIVVALSVGTALADGEKKNAADGRSAANTAFILEALTGEGMGKIASPANLKREIRVVANKAGLSALPEKVELPSDIAVRLLSGNVAKMLADVCADLFSGNAAELLSRNEPELLSDNTANLLSGNETELLSGNEAELLSGNSTELLSGNNTQLFSGNEPELLSGNEIQFFSNINVEIEFSNSANNNGNQGASAAGSAMATRPKKRGKFGTLDGNKTGTVSLREFSASKTGKKARRARNRFEALDANGDGVLTLEEFTSQDSGGRSVALRKSR